MEVVAEELLQILCRVQNKFGVEDFSVKKYQAIQALVERQPKEMPISLVKRIVDEECSLGERLMLVEVIGNAVHVWPIRKTWSLLWHIRIKR
jgi:hypothetical protein